MIKGTLPIFFKVKIISHIYIYYRLTHTDPARFSEADTASENKNKKAKKNMHKKTHDTPPLALAIMIAPKCNTIQ